jgi:siroheme synthase-like protein
MSERKLDGAHPRAEVPPSPATDIGEDKRYYMACLDLEGRSCLVVGGGSVALEKARGLLECGARVTVVAPQIVPELAALDVDLLRRGYRSADLDDRFLVVAATSTPSVNRRVFRDGEARSLLCNVVDVPELCSFILPAVVRRDPIAIAVSTGGASPALAQRIRDDIADVVGPEHAELARRLRDLRPWAKTHLATYAERRDFFAEIVAAELA